MSIFNDRKEAGYTLTELLVVLMLLGFITSIGPPALARAVPSVMLKTQTLQIEADVNMMRREAMQTASIFEFVIEPAQRAYVIKTQDKTLIRRDWPAQLKIIRIGSEQDEAEDTHTAFYARPDGQLEGPGLLLTSRGKGKKISVEPFTKSLQRQ